jgi:hypothetical protein
VSTRLVHLLLLLPTVLTSACAIERMRLYPGEPRPAPEVALLTKQWRFFYGPWVFISEVDGTTIPKRREARYELELTPGLHTIKFGYQSAYSYSTENAVVAFVAEAGHVYEARAEPIPPGFWKEVMGGESTWQASVFDKTTMWIVGLPQKPTPTMSSTPTPSALPAGS